MNVAHFYHLFAGGDWREIVNDHLDALEASGFEHPMYVGLIGTPEKCADALDTVCRRRHVDVAAQSSRGAEEVTLAALHQYAKTHEGLVLYAHTKGASHGG
jgi:hypothetical protein